MASAPKIDHLCHAFLSEWSQGSEPRIEHFLQRIAPEQRGALIQRLIATELAFRQHTNGLPQVNDYVRRFPDHIDSVQNAFAVVESVSSGSMSLEGDVTVPPSSDPAEQRNVRSDEDKTVDTDRVRFDEGPTMATGSKLCGEAASPPRSTPEPNTLTHVGRPSVTNKSSVQSGKHLGDYEILNEIARGGMGVVYKARQRSLNRIVALKMILSGQFAGDEDVQRFYAEAEAAANLDHPGIVPIYDVGEVDGQHYFSMGFVDGQSLSEMIADGPLPPRQAATYAMGIAEAIAFAHDRGVIHRDLKPANVLIDSNGQPKVTDFGLAKKLKEDSGLTATGQVLGTPNYMPPEQASGRLREVRETSDVYSLGAILYCLLTGRPPFHAASPADTLLQVIQREPPAPRLVNPQTPRDLETITLKCLSKDARQRYSTAIELRDELDRFLNGEPILAHPINSFQRAWRLAKRKPVVSSLSAATALLLLIVAIGSPLIAWNQASLRRQAVKETAESTFQLANARWETNRVAEARDLLHQIPDEFRDNFEWRFCNRYFLGSDLTCYGHTGGVYGVAFSPDGTRLASGSVDHTIKIWDAQTGQEITTLTGHSDTVYSVAFSPDGSSLASGSRDKAIKIWDAQIGHEITTLTGHAGVVTSVAFSPDGAQLASGSYDRTIKIWDTESGQENTTLTGHTDHVSRVAFSPAGTRLASGDRKGLLKIWDTQTGQEITTLKANRYSLTFIDHVNSEVSTCVAFSPDGARLASGCIDETFKIWDAQTGQEIATLRGHTGGVRSVAFSPDGARLASGADDKTIKIWDAQTGQEITTFRGHTGSVYDMAFSPDGARLVSGAADNTLKIWDAQAGQKTTTLKGHENTVNSVAFSPDGARLASGAADQTIKIWDAQTGQEILTLNGQTIVSSVAFSPDGARLASGATDQTIKIWDAQTGQETITLKGHAYDVSSMAFSPDGVRLASGDREYQLKIWDTQTGLEIAELKGHKGRVSVAYSPDGTRLASGSFDKTIKIWDAQTGQEITTLTGHTGRVYSVAFSPDGSSLASGSWDKTIKIWDAQTWSELATFTGHLRQVHSVAFSPNGARLASGSFDRTIKIWDTQTGQESITLAGNVSGPFYRSPLLELSGNVAFSPDGTRLAWGGLESTIHIWEAPLGQEITTLKGHTEQVSHVAFSPDGTRLASGDHGGLLKIWDAQTGQEITTLTGHTGRVASVAFSPDGSCLASGSWDKTIKIWDAHAGQEIGTLEGHTARVSSVVFNPDSKKIYSRSGNERIVWDVMQRTPIGGAPWNPPTASQQTSPDGRLLVTCEGNDVVLVDLTYKNSPSEKAHREARARFDPWWHREQALKAKNDSNWYAATFHYAWVLKNDPDQAEFYDGLQSSYRMLANAFEEENRDLQPYLTAVVTESLKLPRGTKLSADHARSINSSTWKRIVTPAAFKESPLTYIELNQFRELVQQHPRDAHYNTLGTAEFRMANYKEAIAAAQQSLRRTIIHLRRPGDFAILAMSHFKLGEAEKANEYRAKMDDAMEQFYFKDDEECKSFVAEVEELFESQSATGNEPRPAEL